MKNAYENALFSIAEATGGLFSCEQAEQCQEVSITGIEKKTAAGRKKASSKREIIAVDDKAEILATNSERIPQNTVKATWWCLNVWNDWTIEQGEYYSELFLILP